MSRRHGEIARFILDLGNGWRWQVTFTPLMLYSQGYSLDRGLARPERKFGSFGEKRNILALLGINPFPVQVKSLVPGQKSRVFSQDI